MDAEARIGYPKLQEKSLSNQVYEILRDQILHNRLLPGDPLLIREVSEELGVSATPAREALAKLNAEGLVDSVPNKTARVAAVTEGAVRQVFEARKLVEPYCFAAAAKAASSDTELKRRMRRLRRLIAEVRDFVATDCDSPDVRDESIRIGQDLQSVVEVGTRNPLLRKVDQLVTNQSVRMRWFRETIARSSAEVLLIDCDEHLAIIDAMLDCDVERTQRMVLKHLENGELRTLQAVNDKESKQHVPGGAHGPA